MRHPEDQHDCPLFKSKIFWGECWIVQDIRDDNTDMEFAIKAFDLKEAEQICEKCRWYHVNSD